MAELLESHRDGVATLTLNRPEVRNAVSGSLLDALHAALLRLARDTSVRCVVLTGAGTAFCAGGDMSNPAGEGAEASTLDRALTILQDGDVETAVYLLREAMEVSRLLHEMPKPTIAALPGAAAGAGFSLALACDLRIAARGAKITTAFARVGFSGDYGGSYFLSKLVGSAKARELYFLSDVLLAEEALTLGIVNKVVDAADLAAETWAMASRIAQGPRLALAYMKHNLNAAESGTLGEVLDLEALHHFRCAITEDHREAARAFVEKRAPKFTGK